MPLWVRSLVNTLLLPGTVAGVLPYLIGRSGPRLPLPLGDFRWLSLLFLALGLLLLFLTIWDFGAKGRGTLAPWDAPKELSSRTFTSGSAIRCTSGCCPAFWDRRFCGNPATI